MQIVDIDIDEVDTISHSSADDDITQTLHHKILSNYQRIVSLLPCRGVFIRGGTCAWASPFERKRIIRIKIECEKNYAKF